MKTIQVINYFGSNKYGVEELTISSLSNPQSLDAFDITVIDLSDKLIWTNDENSFKKVNLY